MQYACPEANLDFSGFDVGALEPDLGITGWEECGFICSIFPACTFWTYNRDGWCFLKNSDAGAIPCDGCFSGTRDCPGAPTAPPPTVKNVK